MKYEHIWERLNEGKIVFSVNRRSDFRIIGGYINYDKSNVNNGGAMDVTDGIFMAPLDGIYLFHFRALITNPVQVSLVVNSNINIKATSYRDRDDEQVSLIQTLSLIKGDKVACLLETGGYLQGANLKNMGATFEGFYISTID